MDASPIAIFVYKRPQHTRRMLESLKANPGWEKSPLLVFCDGARRPEDAADVVRTREVVYELLGNRAQMVEQTENRGLARSIIAGVTDIVSRYGRVIVLEDDLTLSPVALGYFNTALNQYQCEERVMHISAYMFPVPGPLPEAFFYREATCWGWATWSRAWSAFEPDGQVIRNYILSNNLKHEFDVRGTMDFFGMLEAQIAGKVDSWAIRWYGSMFMKGGLALHPGRSLMQNTGFDGSGVNCQETSFFDVAVSDSSPEILPGKIVESEEALRAMTAFRSNQRSPRLKTLRRFYRQMRDWF